MQIRIDAHGKEEIRLTVTETRKLNHTVRLLESMSRAQGDTELRQALELIKAKLPVVTLPDKKDDF